MPTIPQSAVSSDESQQSNIVLSDDDSSDTTPTPPRKSNTSSHAKEPQDPWGLGTHEVLVDWEQLASPPLEVVSQGYKPQYAQKMDNLICRHLSPLHPGRVTFRYYML